MYLVDLDWGPLITILFSIKIIRANLQAKCFPNLDEVS